MPSHDYRGIFGADGSRNRVRRAVPELPAEAGLVVEDPASGFCGAVVAADSREVTLEDRHGRRRVFPLVPAGIPRRRRADHPGAPGAGAGRARPARRPGR